MSRLFIFVKIMNASNPFITAPCVVFEDNTQKLREQIGDTERPKTPKIKSSDMFDIMEMIRRDLRVLKDKVIIIL